MITRKRTLRALWIVVPIVAFAELLAQYGVTHSGPDEADWQQTAVALQERHRPGDLVQIVPDWDRVGRRHLSAFLTPAGLGAFDTSGYSRLIEVSTRGGRSPFSQGLDPQQSATFGDVELRTYDLPSPAPDLFDLTFGLEDCRVEGSRGVRPEFIIDNDIQPRYMVRVPLKKEGVSIACPNVPLRGALRYRAVVDYFKGKWDKSSPVNLEISVDGKRVSSELIPNLGSSKERQVALPAGDRGTLRFEVRADEELNRRFGLVARISAVEEDDR